MHPRRSHITWPHRIVKELTPGSWVIQVVSAAGVSTGRTLYPTQAAAVQEAQRQYPSKEIIAAS
jgi:hypothetical protein